MGYGPSGNAELKVPLLGVAVAVLTVQFPLASTIVVKVAPLIVRVTVLPGSAVPVTVGGTWLVSAGDVIVGEIGAEVSIARVWVAGAEVLPAASVAVTEIG